VFKVGIKNQVGHGKVFRKVAIFCLKPGLPKSGQAC
jgi:hypothetical protein